jgi:hypothetical protein
LMDRLYILENIYKTQQICYTITLFFKRVLFFWEPQESTIH